LKPLASTDRNGYRTHASPDHGAETHGNHHCQGGPTKRQRSVATGSRPTGTYHVDQSAGECSYDSGHYTVGDSRLYERSRPLLRPLRREDDITGHAADYSPQNGIENE
jgi:hypothetical protein